MLGSPPEEPPEGSGPRLGNSPATRGRSVRFLLPSPVSEGHALSVLILGFAVEGATEVYQFLMRGNLVQGPLVYYTTLATTLFGFYLMFLGFREWHAYHPKSARSRPVSWPQKRRWPWFGLALWTGGTAMTAVLGIVLGGGGTEATPFWIAWPVGGIVVLAFGNFFFGLMKLAQLPGLSWANALGWAAFIWALGVSAVSGLVIGDRAILLLTELVTNWVALIESIAPIVVAISPLFVSYALIIGAYWPALDKLRGGIT
jgi:hypothetical protein